MNAEELRLEEARERKEHWRRWGPYLSERQWGTVREDYSPNGTAWEHLSHDQARSRAYRWGEDGIAGISDNHQRLCFALALWNEADPILKERMFGLTGNEGNHGEDVKEYYHYLDSTPTHSYMKFVYKYPQAEFPYARLVAENRARGRADREFELIDTGVFDQDRYFDVFVEYAKAGVDDILIRITAHNRGPQAAPLRLLPTLWFRNTWSWAEGSPRPSLRRAGTKAAPSVRAEHPTLGVRRLYCEGAQELLFTENETNVEKLYGGSNKTPFVKDAFHERLVHGVLNAVNADGAGTKAAAHYERAIPAGGSTTIRLRLSKGELKDAFGDFDAVFAARLREADEFYAQTLPEAASADMKLVERQALAGMLWSKQFYHYDMEKWLDGDPAGPPVPDGRAAGRNGDWRHLYCEDVLSMPDKWEYPWFAAWDHAFHLIPLALVDPDFAKDQLVLLTREWYMHPNGQLPAYEWAFGDVNPPVQAWAAWRVYKIDKKRRGAGDRLFLERVFQKLLINFTWWVNRKDAEGRNIFQGGFLGLDNIGVFDRSARLPTGGHLEQSDGTSWMAMYCLNLLTIALELAREEPAYEDIASKFFEHFLRISAAMNKLGGEGLWDEEDGFYYDVLHLPDGSAKPMRIRSMVGLIPLFAVETLDPEVLEALPAFKRRMDWFIANRPELAANVSCLMTEGVGHRHLLSIVSPDKLGRILEKVLHEEKFLGPHGVRSVSRWHASLPYEFAVDGRIHRVDYEPAESRSGLFGGNSNWRGPVWFPLNYLLIESLQKFHHYLGDGYTVEIPTGSGQRGTLWDAATEISHRLISIFARGRDGRRPVFGGVAKFQNDPFWRDQVPFYEYFHGDDGSGIGAGHQTGWTGLVAKLLQQCGEYCGTGRKGGDAATRGECDRPPA